MRRIALSLVLLGLALGAACAHLKDDLTVCPEYRSLRCLTKEECTMDDKRACKVCRCSETPDPSRPSNPADEIPPEQR